MVTAMIIWNFLLFVLFVLSAFKWAYDDDPTTAVIATLVAIGAFLTAMTLADALK